MLPTKTHNREINNDNGDSNKNSREAIGLDQQNY